MNAILYTTSWHSYGHEFTSVILVLSFMFGLYKGYVSGKILILYQQNKLQHVN